MKPILVGIVLLALAPPVLFFSCAVATGIAQGSQQLEDERAGRR